MMGNGGVVCGYNERAVHMANYLDAKESPKV